MKKSFLTFAAIALVFSFTSCKETSAETTEEVEVIEAPVEEVIETPVEEAVDTTSEEAVQLEEKINEAPVE